MADHSIDPVLWLRFGAFAFAAFGGLLGSFTNVVILRMAAGRSVVFPPSACPHCGRRLTVVDLVPVLSWLFLFGRCRTCRAPISWQYPVVEAAVAAVLVTAFIRYPYDVLGLVPGAGLGVIWLVVAVCWLRAETAAAGVFLWPLFYRVLLDGATGSLPGSVFAVAIAVGLLGLAIAGKAVPGEWRPAWWGVVVGTLMANPALQLPWAVAVLALALVQRAWPVRSPGHAAGFDRMPLFLFTMTAWTFAGVMTTWR